MSPITSSYGFEAGASMAMRCPAPSTSERGKGSPKTRRRNGRKDMTGPSSSDAGAIAARMAHSNGSRAARASQTTRRTPLASRMAQAVGAAAKGTANVAKGIGRAFGRAAKAIGTSVSKAFKGVVSAVASAPAGVKAVAASVAAASSVAGSGAHADGSARGRSSKGTLLERAHRFLFNRRDESSYFEPHKLGFWRNLLVYLFLFSMVGHAMEIPYVTAMDSLFGIVEEDYAANVDPWYLPYWVYGIGAVALSLIMVPMKIHILKHRKTLWGACLQFFVYAVVLCAILETVMGLIINQPDELGVYPYWDNSMLPLNILEQGWLVNDLFLGVVSVLFVWVLFPICQKAFKMMGERWANRVFLIACGFCAFCCIMSYAVPPIMGLFQ